jgi:hypothetical protein
MSEDFCPKLWEKYQQLRNKKIAFDRAAQIKPTSQALAEIKLIGREVYEFYGLFRDRAVDLFLESVKKREGTEDALIEQTRLISDFMTAAFLYLDEEEFDRLLTKFLTSNQIDKKTNYLLSKEANDSEEEKQLLELYIIETYIYLQKNFYKQKKSNFKITFSNYLKHVQGLKNKKINYPFNPARLISQFAQMKDSFEDEDYKEKIDQLKDIFDLEEYEAQSYQERESSLESIPYLKHIFKKIALDNDESEFGEFLSKLLSSKPSLQSLNEENLNLVQTIFICSLENLKKPEKHDPYIFVLTSFLKLLIQKIQEKNKELKNPRVNSQTEKEAYFFHSKLYELIWALKEKNLFHSLTEEIFKEITKFHHNALNLNKQEFINFIFSHQTRNRHKIKKFTPKDNSNPSNPALIVDLMEFGKINQAKFERYKNVA